MMLQGKQKEGMEMEYDKDLLKDDLMYGNSEDKKQQIIENMLRYGGSFVKSLAECCIRADHNNYKKLVDAFIDYFWDYRPEAWRGRNV